MEKAEFDRLGAFIYSPEENTPAAKMPDQIPPDVSQERLDRLMRLQQTISEKRNHARIGQTETVLITGSAGEKEWYGRTMREAPEIDGQILVSSPDYSPEEGSFVSVRITESNIYDLKGVIL